MTKTNETTIYIWKKSKNLIRKKMFVPLYVLQTQNVGLEQI